MDAMGISSIGCLFLVFPKLWSTSLVSSMMTRLFHVRRKQWPEMSSPLHLNPSFRQSLLVRCSDTSHTPVASSTRGNKTWAKLYQTTVQIINLHQMGTDLVLSMVPCLDRELRSNRVERGNKVHPQAYFTKY